MPSSAPALAAGAICLALGGCALALGGSKAPITYDIIAPRSFSATPHQAKYQLSVSEPTAVHALETDRIMVRPAPDKVSYYKGVAWSDRLPRLVQARMIETFQNAGAVKSVSAGAGDYTLSTELRSFQMDVSDGHAAAEVDIFAKMINNSSGKVVAQKDFSTRVASASDEPSIGIAALNQAFTEVMQDTTTWVSSHR